MPNITRASGTDPNYFRKTAGPLIHEATVAETVATAFYSPTPMIQIAVTHDAGTLTNFTATIDVYSKVLSTDTVYSINPNGQWVNTTATSKRTSEIFTVGVGYHKLVIASAITVTGASGAIGIAWRPIF